MFALRAGTSEFANYRTRTTGRLALLGMLAVACMRPDGVARAEPNEMNVECHIRASSGAGLLRLDAVARAKEAITGHYVLSVRKNNSSGTSENLQSGGFSLPREQEQVLTTVVLEGAAQGHVAAKLSLEWGQGKVSCSLP